MKLPDIDIDVTRIIELSTLEAGTIIVASDLAALLREHVAKEEAKEQKESRMYTAKDKAFLHALGVKWF